MKYEVNFKKKTFIKESEVLKNLFSYILEKLKVVWFVYWF